jgi:D-alanyl-D-alanine carboxypeptidase
MIRREWVRWAGLAAGVAAGGATGAGNLAGSLRGPEVGGPLWREGTHPVDGSGREDPPPGNGPSVSGVPLGAPGWEPRAWEHLTRRLEGFLDDLVSRRDVVGAAMGAASGDGGFRWLGARGEAAPGGAAMTPETPWFMASITKLYIAACIMRLVEGGELTLGDRLVDLLPPGITRGLHARDGVDRTGEITVEHLLAHASGLPDFIEDYPRRGASRDRRSLVEILLEEGDRDWTLDDTVRRVREVLRPHFPPQDLDGRRVRIRYSDTNFQLLTAIVEARTGEPFHRALEGMVLEPLGLEATWVPGHPRPGTPSIAPAVLRAGGEVVDFPRFFRSIADLNATSGDLLRFLAGLTGEGLFRDPATWPRMQARWNRFGQPTDRAALRQPGWPIQYGLGVMRFQLPRFLPPFRPPPAVVGHTGSTGTWLFHCPELDLFLVGSVSQITAGPLPYRFVPRILTAALEVREG